MIRSVWRRGFLVAVVSLPLAGLAAPKEISLQDAQRFAVDHNFGLQALGLDIESSRAGQSAARSLFLPKLGLVGGFENREGGSKRDSATLGYLYGNWNIFNGFADQMEMRRSQIFVRLAESQYRLAETELRAEVMRLFYRYLYQKTILSYYEQAKELNANHLAAARRRRGSGLLAVSDVMDFELRGSSISSEMRSIRQQMDETKLGLVRLMGPDIGSSFEPVGSLPHMHLVGKLDDYLSKVSTSVEVLKQATLQTESSVADLRKRRSEWFPAVDMEVRMGALPIDQRLDDSSRGTTGMVTAKWEFFSGFNTSAQVRQAEVQLGRREVELKALLMSAMAAVEVAYGRLRAIEERVDLELQNEERALNLYKSTLSEYNRGVKNSTDLKAAEQILLDARLRRVGFKNEFLENKVELEKTYSIRLDVKELKDAH